MSAKSINDLAHELIGAAIVAEERLAIELKTVEKRLPIHGAQLPTYLRLGKFSLGLLIHFNGRKLVDGIERVSHDAPNLSATFAPSAFQNPPT